MNQINYTNYKLRFRALNKGDKTIDSYKTKNKDQIDKISIQIDYIRLLHS